MVFKHCWHRTGLRFNLHPVDVISRFNIVFFLPLYLIYTTTMIWRLPRVYWYVARDISIKMSHFFKKIAQIYPYSHFSYIIKNTVHFWKYNGNDNSVLIYLLIMLQVLYVLPQHINVIQHDLCHFRQCVTCPKQSHRCISI